MGAASLVSVTLTAFSVSIVFPAFNRSPFIRAPLVYAQRRVVFRKLQAGTTLCAVGGGPPVNLHRLFPYDLIISRVSIGYLPQI